EFLRDTLTSVAAQTYRNFEHIFVDGGSTDGTLDMIAQVPGDVQVIDDAALGISHAMNAGILAARGDVILHLHSDDYLPHPRCLQRVAMHFQQQGCSWLYGRALSDRHGYWTPELPVFHPYSYRRLLKGYIIPHVATYVRRDLFERVGLFDESLRYTMDYDMWLRLGRVEDPFQTREFLGVFRAHSGSTTHANRLASLLEEHRVRRTYLSPWAPSRLVHELRQLKRRYDLRRAPTF
ncbi:MAG: glycosyltransferase family 2 protein, partial [Gammaproteobacteria bacterium]